MIWVSKAETAMALLHLGNTIQSGAVELDEWADVRKDIGIEAFKNLPDNYKTNQAFLWFCQKVTMLRMEGVVVGPVVLKHIYVVPIKDFMLLSLDPQLKYDAKINFCCFFT